MPPPRQVDGIGFDGRRDRRRGPPTGSSAAGIGYVPEDRGVFAGLTVAENLRLAERRRRRHRDYDTVYELFPELLRRGAAAGRHAVRRAAADGRDRPGAAQRATGCCWSTSRPRAWRPRSSPRSPTCWTGSPSAVPSCWSSRTWPWCAGSAATRVVLDRRPGRLHRRAAALLDDADADPIAARRVGAAAGRPTDEHRRPADVVTGLGLAALYFLVASGLSLVFGLPTC